VWRHSSTVLFLVFRTLFCRTGFGEGVATFVDCFDHLTKPGFLVWVTGLDCGLRLWASDAGKGCRWRV
jgi:hypothetical protein